MYKLTALANFLSALVAASLLAQPAASPLRKLTSIELPGPKGKRSHSLTSAWYHPFIVVAHMHGNQTYFVDTRTNQVAATVTDTPGVEGVEYVPDEKKIYTSNSGDNTIGVIDIAQRKVIKKLKTEAKPDGNTYATPFHKLYVSDERGKAEAVVDTRADTIIKTLRFDSETGMPQYDAWANFVYVNLKNINPFPFFVPKADPVPPHYPEAGA